ncbi:Uncharacterised protein [Raoultella ornithinolytica]|nr:Uncharacterised protein [Raoultella ornithinolytica]
MREVAFQLINARIIQRWNFTILFWTQAGEPGFAGVDDKHLALTVSGDGIDEITQEFIAILVIDADTGFYRDRDGHHVAHRFDTVRYQLRIAHQAGAEHPVLHAVGRTADVEVDLIVAARFRQFRTLRECSRIAAAQLQGQRMLFFAIGQIVAFAMNNRPGLTISVYSSVWRDSRRRK